MQKKFKSVRVFAPKAKKLVLDAVKHCSSDKQIADVLTAIKNVNRGLSGVTVDNVKRWSRTAESQQRLRRGRKVNLDFELEVWSKLVTFGVQEKLKKTGSNNGKECTSVVMVRSIAYSYAIVQERARKVQRMFKWTADVNVQRLKFSLKWVHNFFRRMKVSRRRITSERKAALPVSDVRRILKTSQDVIVSKGYLPSQILNLDETALNFAIGPTYVYLPVDHTRASSDACNSKARVTLIPTVAADGNFLPLMFILKHSKSSATDPDQTKMLVIKHLFKKPGFTRADGWKLEYWSRTIRMPNKKTKQDEDIEHKVVYLIHESNVLLALYYISNIHNIPLGLGHVITSQCKAWNDSIRMAMLIDLILKRRADSHGDLFLWMDNCGSHKTSFLSKVYEEAKTTVGLLPPNMTSKLQVLDLVVNGPIKAHIRNLRAARIGDYMDIHTAQCQAAKEKSEKLPDWDMPKPSLEECIRDLIQLFAGQFTSSKFKEGIQKSFLATGTMYSQVNGGKQFATYYNQSDCGVVPVEINKVKQLGFFIDESDLVLNETEILDAVIQIENDEFDEEVEEEVGEEDDGEDSEDEHL
jgi:hypothetical protein